MRFMVVERKFYNYPGVDVLFPIVRKFVSLKLDFPFDRARPGLGAGYCGGSYAVREDRGMTVQPVAVVVFAEVEAVTFSDAAFAVEQAVKNALHSVHSPGRASGYVAATWPGRKEPVLVKVAAVQELNVALNESLVMVPAGWVFRGRSMSEEKE